MHENQSPVPLPRYRCHKVVEAAKIVAVLLQLADDGAPSHVREAAGCRWLTLEGVKDAVEVTAEWCDRHKVQPGGYFVRYADGYTSFSPAEAFEAGYAPLGAKPDGTLMTLAANLIEDPRVEGAVKAMARWVIGTIETIWPGKSVHDERDALRKECADLRQALAASPQAFDALFKADLQEAMSGKRPSMEHAKLIDALARISCCLPADDAELSDPVSVAKKVIALIQKLRNENGEQSKALFDVSLAVEKIDGGTSGTLENLAPRIERIGERLAHAEREVAFGAAGSADADDIMPKIVQSREKARALFHDLLALAWRVRRPSPPVP